MATAAVRAITAITLVATALTGCSSKPQASPPRSGSVWVADEGHDSVSVIDAATNTVTMTLTGIKGPHNIQVGRDNSVVYAVSSAGIVVAIDPATYRVTATAPTGPHPAHVIDAPNGKVYVTNSGDGTVSIYQGPGLSPAGRITLDGMPHGLRAAAGGSVIVVANTMDGAVDLIDPATDKYLGAIPVGSSPAQVAVSADGKYAYTGISDPPSVVKVDLAQRKMVGSASVPNAPVQLYLTPDGNEVVSADQGTKDAQGHTLSVIDTKAMTTRGTVTTGAGPHGVVIDDSGEWAWVTNSFDNTVTAVDLSSSTAMPPIPVGTEPSGISYSSRPPATAPASSTTLDIPSPSTLPPGESQSDPHSGHH